MEELIRQLKQDYPKLKIRAGKRFKFRAPNLIVYEVPPEGMAATLENFYCLRLLHELGHATLEHQNFQTDVERLKMERAAWEQARKFCEHYQVPYDEDQVEQELDSYRDWLHARTRCARCGLTCYQTQDGVYHCPGCAVSGWDS